MYTFHSGRWRHKYILNLLIFIKTRSSWLFFIKQNKIQSMTTSANRQTKKKAKTRKQTKVKIIFGSYQTIIATWEGWRDKLKKNKQKINKKIAYISSVLTSSRLFYKKLKTGLVPLDFQFSIITHYTTYALYTFTCFAYKLINMHKEDKGKNKRIIRFWKFTHFFYAQR